MKMGGDGYTKMPFMHKNCDTLEFILAFITNISSYIFYVLKDVYRNTIKGPMIIYIQNVNVQKLTSLI